MRCGSMRTPPISAEESGARITSPTVFSPRHGIASSSPFRSPIGVIASRVGACCVCAVIVCIHLLCRNCFRDLLTPFFFCGGRKCQWALLKVCEILRVKFRYRELQEVAAYFC